MKKLNRTSYIFFAFLSTRRIHFVTFMVNYGTVNTLQWGLMNQQYSTRVLLKRHSVNSQWEISVKAIINIGRASDYIFPKGPKNIQNFRRFSLPVTVLHEYYLCPHAGIPENFFYSLSSEWVSHPLWMNKRRGSQIGEIFRCSSYRKKVPLYSYKWYANGKSVNFHSIHKFHVILWHSPYESEHQLLF